MLQIILQSEMDILKNHLTPYIVGQIKNGEIDRFECHDNINLISFDWHNIMDDSPATSRIIIYDSIDDLFFLCENKKCLNMVKSLVNNEEENEKTLYTFFSGLIKGDTESLEKIEEEITATEDSLLTTSNKNCAQQIISYRRRAISLKKYYEQLNRIFEGIIENENELISPDSLRYFKILDNRIDRLFANVLNLRDYITQVREAYQAQIDIEQNNLMRVFTVVTAVFLPLTLLVGWYGMNLRMPEFSWIYGYPTVIILSIVIVIFCLILFKKKKWF